MKVKHSRLYAVTMRCDQVITITSDGEEMLLNMMTYRH